MQGGSRPLVPACWFPSVKESPSGEKTAPEQGFPTGFRTRRALRRRNDAGAEPSYATAVKNASPASRAPACYARLAATNREDAHVRREAPNHRGGDGRGPRDLGAPHRLHPPLPQHVPHGGDHQRPPRPGWVHAPARGRRLGRQARRLVLHHPQRLQRHRLPRWRGRPRPKHLPLPDDGRTLGLPHLQGEVRARARGARGLPAPRRRGLRRNDRLHVARQAALAGGPRPGAHGRRHREPPLRSRPRPAPHPQRGHPPQPLRERRQGVQQGRRPLPALLGRPPEQGGLRPHGRRGRGRQARGRPGARPLPREPRAPLRLGHGRRVCLVPQARRPPVRVCLARGVCRREEPPLRDRLRVL